MCVICFYINNFALVMKYAKNAQVFKTYEFNYIIKELKLP